METIYQRYQQKGKSTIRESICTKESEWCDTVMFADENKFDIHGVRIYNQSGPALVALRTCYISMCGSTI